MIQVILTDLGNVLTPFNRYRAADRLSRELVSMHADEIDRLLNLDEQAKKALYELETGAMKFDEFRIFMGKRFGSDLPKTNFAEIWADIFTRNEPVIRLWSRALERNHKLRLYALSDTDPIRLEWIIKLSGLSFAGAAASFMFGVRKPNRRMYKEAVSLAGCKPDECFFVDDVARYVQAAGEYGLVAHHYNLEDANRDDDLSAKLAHLNLL
ncbi:MAG: HAD-IA family hydrolase [Patescibacteria group bacterium]